MSVVVGLSIDAGSFIGRHRQRLLKSEQNQNQIPKQFCLTAISSTQTRQEKNVKH